MTKISLENLDGKFVIESYISEPTIYDMAHLLRRLLLAAGFDGQNVAEVLPGAEA